MFHFFIWDPLLGDIKAEFLSFKEVQALKTNGTLQTHWFSDGNRICYVIIV